MISLVIPTLLSKEKVQPKIDEIRQFFDGEILASCIYQSASKNRNWCIEQAKNDLIVMMDDDVTGFYPGCFYNLVYPLISRPDKFSIVSIRCLGKDNNPCPMLGDPFTKPVGQYQKAIHTLETGINVVLSACIAFYRTNIRFDENYRAANYEDSDFCMQYNNKYPDKEIIINNTCQLVHLNEQKKTEKDCNQYNRGYFNKKWGTSF